MTLSRRPGKDIAELWRRKRHARRRITIGAVNLAPMMDMMFNLLVFFLVATSFKLPEALLAARVPRTTGLSEQVPVPLVPIKIYLEPSAPGQTIIRVSSAVRADATTLTMVEDFQGLFEHLDQLRNRPGITDQTPVIIATRDRTPWDQVVDAYNAALRAQYRQIVFAAWKSE